MYNELKLNMIGKLPANLTMEEQYALLFDLEERIGALLEAYGVEDIKYNDMISKVVYIDDSYDC